VFCDQHEHEQEKVSDFLSQETDRRGGLRCTRRVGPFKEETKPAQKWTEDRTDHPAVTSSEVCDGVMAVVVVVVVVVVVQNSSIREQGRREGEGEGQVG